jgi:CubicO group peptidase (beta-lactamase class C family)
MLRLVCCSLALLVLPAAASAAAPAARADDRLGKSLDDFVAEVMKEYQVPGLALAVVKDGKVLIAKGYGYRDLEKKVPVTASTLFAIGSISKSFTVTALGMLIDEKKLTWDSKVRDLMPSFRLHERLATDKVTVRDLVTHRTGLPRHDALWYCTTLGRGQLLDRLRHLEPTHDLREQYQYNNLAYATAGVVVEKVSGKSWEDFTRERVLTPLGMKRTNLSVKDSVRSDDFAFPYRERDGKVSRIPFRNIDPVAPAGSINSSAEEMANYLRMHLELGKWDGKQLLSQVNAEEMQAPQMVIPLAMQKLTETFATPGENTYGLGFQVTRHRGERMIEHGGSIDGFLASLSLLPAKKTGVVVMINLHRRDFAPVPRVVAHEVHDRLLGLSGIDWRERGRKLTSNAVKFRDDRKKQLEKDRKPDTSPSHALAELAGTYDNPAYGKLDVAVSGKELKLRFAGSTVLAKHYHYNSFVIVDGDELPAAMLEDRLVTFVVGKKGMIERVKVQTELGVAETVFERAADKAGK